MSVTGRVSGAPKSKTAHNSGTTRNSSSNSTSSRSSKPRRSLISSSSKISVPPRHSRGCTAEVQVLETLHKRCMTSLDMHKSSLEAKRKMLAHTQADLDAAMAVLDEHERREELKALEQRRAVKAQAARTARVAQAAQATRTRQMTTFRRMP